MQAKNLAGCEETVARLDADLINLRKVRTQLETSLADSEAEIERLRRVESEFTEFKRSIIENSPPASTQIPKSIENEVKKTPRSPFLSEKLNHLVCECRHAISMK